MKKLLNIGLVIVLLVGVGVLVKNRQNLSSEKDEKEVGAETPEVLRMGLIPADDAEEQMRNYQPMADYLEETLEMKVEMIVTHDYTAAIEAMRAKHLDVAWFGPFSYVLANKEANAEAIVVGLRRDTGESSYRTFIVTQSDSGIKTLDDIKGKTFAFVDPASTSGNLIPRKLFAEAGIDPEADFASIIYAGTHNTVALAIQNKTVEAGAYSDTTYRRMIEENQLDKDATFIIAKSPPIPGSPIVVRGDLPEELKQEVKQAILEMDQQVMHKVQGWGDIEKYVETTDADYNVIRETAKVLNLDLTEQK